MIKVTFPEPSRVKRELLITDTDTNTNTGAVGPTWFKVTREMEKIVQDSLSLSSSILETTRHGTTRHEISVIPLVTLLPTESGTGFLTSVNL